MKSISFDQAQRKRQKYWKTSFISISPQRSGQLSTPHLSWPKFRSRHVMMPTISIMQDGIRKLLRTCRLKPHKVSAPNKLPSRLPKADEITDLFDSSSRIRVRFIKNYAIYWAEKSNIPDLQVGHCPKMWPPTVVIMHTSFNRIVPLTNSGCAMDGENNNNKKGQCLADGERYCEPAGVFCRTTH